jgi:uncharacterized membrane protein
LTPTPTDPATVDKKLVESVEAAIGAEIGPGEARARVALRISRLVAEFYRGPLPHPRHLKAYEDACSGAANRILAMAEKAQARQEDRLDKAMDYEYADRRLGLHYGLCALIALLIAGVTLTALGHVPVGASLLGAAVLGTAIGTFVHGRRDQNGDSAPASQTETPDGAQEEQPKEQPNLLKRILAVFRP